MSAEEAWKTWWEAEGKHMKRLPHHNAMDHMASVTRIAWLNGAFGAADEIERLRAERDVARREVCVWQGLDTATKSNEVARVRGWDCFKEDGKPCQ
jgi:hypothetical protein